MLVSSNSCYNLNNYANPHFVLKTSNNLDDDPDVKLVDKILEHKLYSSSCKYHYDEIPFVNELDQLIQYFNI